LKFTAFITKLDHKVFVCNFPTNYLTSLTDAVVARNDDGLR
jgi:hypothetical protein